MLLIVLIYGRSINKTSPGGMVGLTYVVGIGIFYKNFEPVITIKTV